MRRMNDPSSPIPSWCGRCPSSRTRAKGQHAFAYTITIRNTGDVTAQLIARHWIITDGEGRARRCAASRWWATNRCSSRARSFEYTS